MVLAQLSAPGHEPEDPQASCPSKRHSGSSMRCWRSPFFNWPSSLAAAIAQRVGRLVGFDRDFKRLL